MRGNILHGKCSGGSLDFWVKRPEVYETQIGYPVMKDLLCFLNGIMA